MNTTQLSNWVKYNITRMTEKGYDHVRFSVAIYAPEEHTPFVANFNYRNPVDDDDTIWKTIHCKSVNELEESVEEFVSDLEGSKTVCWKHRIRMLEDLRDELSMEDQDAVAKLVDDIIAPIRTNLLEYHDA